MKAIPKTDLCLGLCAIALVVFANVSAYRDGRYGTGSLIPPAALALMSVPFILLVLVLRGFWSRLGGLLWQRLALRGGMVVAAVALWNLSSWRGVPSYPQGCEDHVRDVFTLPVINELRAVAQKKLDASPGADRISLSGADLPASVTKTAWGSPAAYASRNFKDQTLEVEVYWGSALVGHHGILLSEEDLTRPMTEAAKTWGTDSPSGSYTPWLGRSYITYDPY